MIREMREKGCYQREIAERLGISERTVRRALKRGGTPARRRAGIRASKLDAFKGQIDQLLSEGVWNAEVIFAEIQARGYGGGRSILRKYIRPKRALRVCKGTVRFETGPGRQLQHDWGEIVTVVAGERRKVHVAVNTLSYSRRFHVWASWHDDAEHTYESLVCAFEHFGGVPQEVWVDNQKAAVLSHETRGSIRFNPGFLQLADHYGFMPKACRPGRPQTKGKDERMVGYVKHNFFQRYRDFETLEHINRLLQGWLVEVADRRFHGTVKEIVAERFEEERPHLQSLSPVRFDTSYRKTRRVALDAFVDVHGNRYSVPAHMCGETVAVHIGLDDRLRVFDAAGELVAEHLLRPVTAGWQVVPSHHARLWRETFQVQTRDLRCYEEARPWS
jgi:transposase